MAICGSTTLTMVTSRNAMSRPSPLRQPREPGSPLQAAAPFLRGPRLSRIVDALLHDGVEGERGTALWLFLARHEVPAGHIHERQVGREPHVLLGAALRPD